MSFSLDLSTAINSGFSFAGALIVSFTGVLGIVFGFNLFRAIWRMILGFFENLHL